MNIKQEKAYFHLPGLFEFYSFYKEFLPLYFKHREYFYDWCEIGSIYGAPADCIWGGGRVGFGDDNINEVYELTKKYKISSRLTFSNSLLEEKHLKDSKCNELCKLFNDKNNGIIIYSDLLLSYIKKNYSNYHFIATTTKVLTNFEDLKKELDNDNYLYVVPDFRLNKNFEKLNSLSIVEKNKVEFLVNECCYIGCLDRKKCYEQVSLKNLGMTIDDFRCKSPESQNGYRFSKAMKNPSFISRDDIVNKYMPMGFSNFKIEGRSLGSAILLEFILYYMVKPEYQINVREELYLDSELDLF